MRYHPTHRDKNHKPIVEHLQAHGVEVVEVFQPLDLLCQYYGFIGWIEVKLPKSHAVYTRQQIRFMAETQMPVYIAQSGEDAMNFLRTGKGLQQHQKDALAAFLVRDDRTQFHRQIIERTLACGG